MRVLLQASKLAFDCNHNLRSEDPMSTDSYLLSGQLSELDRLQLQSRVWEPAGRRLLDQIGTGRGSRAVDLGCGAMGWLGLLSDWVGPDGHVVGTDIQEKMLEAATQFVDEERLDNVEIVHDDVFASQLEPGSFDLVHARFLLGPLGRGDEQLATYLRLLRPGGILVLEDVDPASLHFLPPAPASAELRPLIVEAISRAGGEPEGGPIHLRLFDDADIEPIVRAEVQALPPGHPYNRLLLQFANNLDGLLRSFVEPDQLDNLREQAEAEVEDPERWGITFTLLQTWGRSVT